MYRVYQASVEQTRLLAELQTAVEDQQDEISFQDQKQIHLEPSGIFIKNKFWNFSILIFFL